MLIQLRGKEAGDYQRWIRLYERVSGKVATATERTEAFFAATSGSRPWWAIGVEP